MAHSREQDSARGRESVRPGEIPRLGWRDILLRTKDEVSKDNIGLVAAGMAFYGLLAVFPALTALVSIYGLVADPAQVQQHLQAMSGVMPDGARQILDEQMGRVASSGSGALSMAVAGGILLALWSATKGTKAFMTAMNIVYDEDERRGFFKLSLVSLGLTAFAILLALLTLAVLIVLPVVLAATGVGAVVNWLVTLLRWPLIAVVFIFGLAVLYRFAPSRSRARWRWISPGSIAAVVLWLIASVAFSIYVRNFGSYNETYGSLGAVIGMLMWFWLSAFVVLLGAEMNSEMERQTRCDTTGQDRPLGERGAYAADTVGERP